MRHDFRDIAEKIVRPPAACPVCKSTEITTASKTITSATYWRCVKCGEVWNEERLDSGSRGWRRYR